jgi:hypothetical protein
MCTLDADHPFIAPGPNDVRGRGFLLLENVKKYQFTHYFPQHARA